MRTIFRGGTDIKADVHINGAIVVLVIRLDSELGQTFVEATDAIGQAGRAPTASTSIRISSRLVKACACSTLSRRERSRRRSRCPVPAGYSVAAGLAEAMNKAAR